MHQQAHAPASSVTAKAVRLIFFSISNLCLIMTTQAQTNTFPNSGNAGVGTATPGSKFEVIGSTRMKGKLVVDSLAKFKEDVQVLGELKIISLKDTALNYNRVLGISKNGKVLAYPNIQISGNSITSRKVYARRITTLPGDSLLHFGDSSLVFNTIYNRIYGDCFVNQYGYQICGTAIGRTALAVGGNSIAIGNYVTTGSNSNSIVIGSGVNQNNVLNNNIANSLVIGFNSTLPSIFVAPGSQNIAGQVGINTTYIPANYVFAVKGKMIAEEVEVNLYNLWPDYVFAKDYALLTLPELEKYILENHHLPKFLSAKEIKEKGTVAIGETQRLQQETIEELVLYLIELKKWMGACY